MKKYLRTLVAPTVALALTASLAPAALAEEPAQPAAANAPVAASTITPLTPENVAELAPAAVNQKWWPIAQADPRVDSYVAYSPAMGRNIPVAVIAATNEAGERVTGAPTLYLLNGAGGAEQNNDWLTLNKTDESTGTIGTIDFYSGKGVNVVIPMAGAFSYYLDWAEEPNGTYLKGPQKWETFLTQELPGPLESTLQANDRRGIVGFSMSALPAVLFAGKHPGFYQAVAGYSGYYGTTDPISYKIHGLTLDRGGATPEQILGERGSQHNLDNDPFRFAEGLAGTAMYFANGTGLAAETDLPGYYMKKGYDFPTASNATTTLQVEGGIIEAATNKSTHDLQAKLNSLNIPATFNFRNTGTHSWPSWRDDQVQSWDVLHQGLFG